MQRRPPPAALPPPLTETDIARLQSLLDAVPAPLEPLDAVMLDGYLCGVLLQPRQIAEADWLPPVFDSRGEEEDSRPAPLPAAFDAAPLHELLRRRHAELDAAIARREWFDPWVFELDAARPSEAVYPWVAGFALALGHFPGLLSQAAGDRAALIEPLALVYRHLEPDDLEDADELLAEIETLEPPADLAEAVEELVRATLLLADVSRPAAPAVPRRGSRKGRRPQGR